MRLVRIGVACTSTKVGDFDGNLERLKSVVEAARGEGVHCLVTPELSITGYSLEDRIWWPDIARRSWDALQALAQQCRDITVFAGLPVVIDGLMYNACACIHDGAVHGMLLKKWLPTYGIFYEGRNWAAWAGGVTDVHGLPAGDLVFKLPYGVVSGEICEDLWSAKHPGRERVLAGAEVLVNPNASPFTPLKNEQRKRLVLNTAERLGCVYAYANMLGLDSCRLVFDGGGIIATPADIVAEGELLSIAPWTLTSAIVDLEDVVRSRSENSTWRQFVAERDSPGQVMVVDASEGDFTPAAVKDFADQMPKSFYVPDGHDTQTAERASRYLDELFDALILGLRDYYEKTGVFDRFLIALSGGRDSALCLVLATHAAKAMKNGQDVENYADRVWAAYLPTEKFSSSETHDAAESLAKELGVGFRVIPIEDERKIAAAKHTELMGGEENVSHLALQNLQARIRGAIMLNWSNSAKGLVLVTSNLSEAAVGYTTTGGDNQGGYSPIANVPKTLVTTLLDYISKRDGVTSLQKVLAQPPSAELDENQTDEEDLMPYAVLDDLLYLFAERRMSLPDSWRVMAYRRPEHDAEQLRRWTSDFGRLFAYNQWKREQLPASLKVLELDLDPKTGFRFPVTQSIEKELEELRDAKL